MFADKTIQNLEATN